MIESKFQKLLLKLASDNVLSWVKDRKGISLSNYEIPQEYYEIKGLGAFVTIKLFKKLRGCIGSITSDSSLIDLVLIHSHNAAFNDFRFPKVSAIELSHLNFEISVLQVPKKIENFKDINLGEDGIVIKKDGKRGVFLPHVPKELNWNLETTLTNLCLKAKLDKFAWKAGAEFETFSAFKF